MVDSARCRIQLAAPEWLGPLDPTYNYRCLSKPRALFLDEPQAGTVNQTTKSVFFFELSNHERFCLPTFLGKIWLMNISASVLVGIFLKGPTVNEHSCCFNNVLQNWLLKMIITGGLVDFVISH
jgi:hypothetical protein